MFLFFDYTGKHGKNKGVAEKRRHTQHKTRPDVPIEFVHVH